MKPFNIEEYLKNPARKVVTGDGRNVRIICTDRKGSNKPILALAQVRADSIEVALTFGTDGTHDIGRESCYDLFFAPEKHEGWINILRYEKHICPMVCIYDSKEKAEENANIGRNCVATVKIEWEE